MIWYRKNRLGDVLLNISVDSTDKASQDGYDDERQFPNWKNICERSNIRLVGFSLKQDASAFIEDLFNPRKQLFFILFIWDYGGVLKVVPYHLSNLKRDWELKFFRQNTRKVFAEKLTVASGAELKGGLNVLAFAYMPQSSKNRYLEIKSWIKGSDFYRYIKEARSNPSEAILEVLENELEVFIEGISRYIRSNGDLLFPLLNAFFVSIEEINKTIDTRYFTMQLEIKAT